jgi:hypothetical protein
MLTTLCLLTLSPFVSATGVETGTTLNATGEDPALLAEEPRLAPKAGSAVLRRIEIEHALTLEQMVFRVGEDQEIMPGTMSLASALKLDLHDEYRALDGERLLNLRRSADAVHFTGDLTITVPAAAGQARRLDTRSLDKRSSLEGKSVVFERAAAGEFGRHFDAQEGSEEALRHLAWDLDMSAFLPPGPVLPGDSWDVPVAALVDVVAPGGSWPLPRGRADDAMFHRSVTSGMGGGLEEAFGGVEDGLLRMTWRGRGSGENAHLGLMDMELHLRLAKVQTKLAAAQQTARERLSNVRIVNASLSLDLEGSGVLTWDMTAGRLAAFSLDGRQRVRMRIVTQRGDEEQREQTLQMAGSLSSRVSTQAAEPRPTPGPR